MRALRILASCLCLFGALCAATDALAVRRFGVFAASARGGTSDVVLRYAERDAGKLRDVFAELGGMDRRDTILVDDATPLSIRAAMRSITARIGRVGDKESVFFFYFSGHSDRAALKLDGERLALAELDKLVESTGARMRIMILDSCRSGIITRSMGGERGPPFVVRFDDRLSTAGEVVISSSSEDELAQESDDLAGSLFTHYLVSGLRGDADRSGDGKVTLREAYEYAYTYTVIGSSESRIGAQHPTFTTDVAAAGDVVLTDLAKGMARLRFPAGARGDFLIWDKGEHAVVAEVKLEGGPSREIAAAPGSYAVMQRLVDKVRVLDVSLEEGQTVAVELGHMAVERYAESELSKAEEGRSRVLIGAGIGFQRFADEQTRGDLIAPVFLYGLKLGLSRFPARIFDLAVDASFAQGETSHRYDPSHESEIRSEYVEIEVSVSLPIVLRRSWFHLHTGPRVSGLWLGRTFPLAGYTQQHLSLSPGAVAGFGLSPVESLVVGAEARVNYLYLRLDEETRNLAYFELWSGLSWVFGRRGGTGSW